MSCIHYKFKSSLDYNSVTFDGLHLSLGDLKKAISTQKRLRQGEFELEIINAQTGDVYKKSDELIAKNTSVIVSRVPVTKTNTSSTQRSWEAFKQECAKVKQQEREKMLVLEEQKKAAEASTVPASEMDKIKAVIDQSTKGFEPSSFQGRNPHAVPHDNYVCKRCGNKGHYIANCPNIKQEDRVIEPRVKRTTGIPSTMLTIVDDPLHPGALLTHLGQFAVPTVDVAGYRDSKKDQPPFSGENIEPEVEKKIIPKELLCHICEDLCVDAAIAPCCGTSFCDECLREELLESEDHQCPSCHETNVSPDRIVANRSMRIAVTNFLNDTGYTKVKRRRSNSTSGDTTPIFPKPPRPPSPPQTVASTSTAPITVAESISSVVNTVPNSTVSTQVTSSSQMTESSYPIPSRSTFQPQPFRGGHNSYRPWHRHEPRYERPHAWNGPQSVTPQQHLGFNATNPPPPILAAAALQAFVTQRLTLPPLVPPGMPGYPPVAPQSHVLHPSGDLTVQQAASPPKKKPVDVFDSFPDFTKKMSRTPELKSRSRSRSGSPPRRSSHSSYSPVKKGSHGRSPRRSSLSRSRSRSRTGSFHRSRSRGRSLKRSRSRSPKRSRSRSPKRTLSRSPKRSRSKSPPRRHRSRSAESRGLSELRSISPDSITKGPKSRSRSPPPPLRSRSRSRSYKRSYRSRSRSWSKSKKATSRSYSPVSPRPLRRSPDRSPGRSQVHSPRRSPYRSPGRSPLYSPIRSRSRRSFTPRRHSKSLSPRRRSPVRSKSRSPFSKRRYSRSRSPVPLGKRTFSPYSKSRRSPSPYNKASYNKNRSPSPYQFRGGYNSGRDRDSKFSRGGGPPYSRLSPTRRPGGLGNAPPPAIPDAPGVDLPPVQLLPNMALPPPEEYFKHNPAGYAEFLRTFYAQVGNQENPWGGPQQGGQHHHPPSGPPFGNSYPPAGQPNGPPLHPPHSGFPQDRRQPPWNSSGPSSRPRSVSPMGRTHSLKYGDRFRRDRDRPGFDNRGGGRDKDRRFDDQRFGGDRNIRRGGENREDEQRHDDVRNDQRYEDRKWRGEHKDRKGDETKDRKFVHSEIKDKRGTREGERRKDGDKTRYMEKARNGGKQKERPSIEKKKSPERKKSPQHVSKQTEKSRKGDDRKKKEEKENVDEKVKSDNKSDNKPEVKKEEPVVSKVEINGDVPNKSATPLEDVTQTKKESFPEGEGDNCQPSQEVEKEKKAPGKKKVGAAGKKLKTKGGNAADGEKKEKKIKKKKLTFGASETDNKGLKKKKLKRVVDYKSENTCTSEDAADPEKNQLSEPSPMKKAKVESNDEGALETLNSEPTDDTNPSKNEEITDGSMEVSLPGNEEKSMSSSTPEKSKNGLMTELPELSKWERDDFDIPEVEKAEEKPKEKSALPRSVVDKAEMFLVGKPMKNSVVATSVTSVENKPEIPEKQKDSNEKHRDVQERLRNLSDKEKSARDVPISRPKERDLSERRDDRHKGASDRHRPSQDERKEDVSDKHRDYRDHRSKSPLHSGRDYNRSGNSKDYRPKSPISHKDYRSKSPVYNKDYRSKSPVYNKDYRSKSPVYNKDYRSKSPVYNKDYRSKSPVYSKDYRSKSPVRSKDYRPKSPIRTKDYRSKSPSERSRKVSIDAKKDQRERKGYDIQITVKGDRDKHNKKSSNGGDTTSYHHSHRYQDRRDPSEEDERSVVRSHSLERELKSKHKKEKEDSKTNEKRKAEKDSSSKTKHKKGKIGSEEKDTATSISINKRDNPSKSKEESAPHRSPRDLRHKIEEKTKSQNKSQASSSQPRKLSVMDESEFVPDYEDTVAPEAAAPTGGGEEKKPESPSVASSPEHKERTKDKATSDEKSSDDEEETESTEVKEGKKHKKSKKKHKHKEKKEKHKHKKKKHKKNKEKDEDE